MIQDQVYSDSESDEDECNRFFSVCAENKINAMIARMREYDENYDRPEEFENEAVSMAIQQHGLRNYEEEGRNVACCECSTEIDENQRNQNMVDGQPTTSTEILSMITDYQQDEEKRMKSKERKHCKNSEIQNLAYKQNINLDGCEFDDVDFLNEAVAVAIKKKGLSSSCNALK